MDDDNINSGKQKFQMPRGTGWQWDGSAQHEWGDGASSQPKQDQQAYGVPCEVLNWQ